MGKEIPRIRKLLPILRVHEDNYQTNIQIITWRTLQYHQNLETSMVGVYREQISQSNEGSD